MSDYLGNLAASNNGVPPTVTPRMRSRFEPMAPRAPIVGENFVSEATREEHVESPREGTAYRGRLDIPPASDAAVGDAQRVSKGRGTEDVSAMRETVDRRNEEIDSRGGAEGFRSAPDLKKNEQGGEARVEGESVVIRPVSAVLARPQIRAFDKREPEGMEKAIGDAPPAPIIRVTIGRIEVRAVQAAAAPARKTEPPPRTLTLEEYLKARERGER